MRKTLLVIVAISIFPTAAFADASDPRYQKLVDEILEVTGALEIGSQMSDFVVAQMIGALKAAGTELPDRAYDMVEEEVRSTIREAIESGTFSRLMYPVYAKYLTAEDLEAALEFYATPAGRKMAQSAPAMATESMMVGQQWGEQLGPVIAANVRSRLAEEGIEIN